MRIAVLANTTWYLFNFRLNLMRALMTAGYEVVAIGPDDAYVEKLRVAGIRHASIPLVGASINPLREMQTVWALYRLFKKEGVDLVLSYTPKGNIYGALAAAMVGIPTVANVSGLGRVFIRRSPLTWLVQGLYRWIFRRAFRVFFQNREDMNMFLALGLVPPDKAERIPGSGVDVMHFLPKEEGGENDERGLVFLLVARMLWDKGVGEYVEAARSLKSQYPAARFCLLGFVGVENPSAIPLETIQTWEKEGIVEYLGHTDDVIAILRLADCVVLPSYREGVPRTLLEAASMAMPVITTDAPGCRDTVDDGVTGFLCQPKDAMDLANKMERMLNLPVGARREMGRKGREKMLREFDERIVIEHYLKVVALVGEA